MDKDSLDDGEEGKEEEDEADDDDDDDVDDKSIYDISPHGTSCFLCCNRRYSPIFRQKR